MNLILAVLELPEHHQVPTCRVREKPAELGISEIPLVETLIDLDHDLLQAVGTHYVVPGRHSLDGLFHQNPGVHRLVDRVGGLSKTGEGCVGVVLVAVLHQNVGTGLLNPHADNVLPVLLQLKDQA